MSMAKERIVVTDHADEEAQNNGLSVSEVLNTISKGEAIEDYPDDEPIHSVWAYSDSRWM